jgi:hypothetical protein
MKPATKEGRVSVQCLESELLRLELMIARRADRLWRRAGRCSGCDLIHWLQAESEVFGRYFGLEQPLKAMLVAGH